MINELQSNKEGATDCSIVRTYMVDHSLWIHQAVILLSGGTTPFQVDITFTHSPAMPHLVSSSHMRESASRCFY